MTATGADSEAVNDAGSYVKVHYAHGIAGKDSESPGESVIWAMGGIGYDKTWGTGSLDGITANKASVTNGFIIKSQFSGNVVDWFDVNVNGGVRTNKYLVAPTKASASSHVHVGGLSWDSDFLYVAVVPTGFVYNKFAKVIPYDNASVKTGRETGGSPVYEWTQSFDKIALGGNLPIVVPGGIGVLISVTGYAIQKTALAKLPLPFAAIDDASYGIEVKSETPYTHIRIGCGSSMEVNSGVIIVTYTKLTP